MTEKEKQIWNDAVRATLNQVKKYDGIIPDDDERKYLCKSVYQRVAYKSENPFTEAGNFFVPAKIFLKSC